MNARSGTKLRNELANANITKVLRVDNWTMRHSHLSVNNESVYFNLEFEIKLNRFRYLARLKLSTEVE